ncbi:hypothetical protein RRF57_011134 [Xylaria bambusicola]|uniref:Uncharacterized protein n=1 Tax=Xylaria bambusicola TaxID=326684 RepID=A0AAN7Z9X7_9PEZI
MHEITKFPMVLEPRMLARSYKEAQLNRNLRPSQPKVKVSKYVVVMFISLQEMFLTVPNHGRSPDRVSITISLDHRRVEMLSCVFVPTLDLLSDRIPEAMLLRQHKSRKSRRKLRHYLVKFENILNKGWM